jgi:hypothetical protein
LTGPDTSQDARTNPDAWLEHLCAHLAAVDLPGHVTEAAGEKFLAVCVSRPGCREAEVTVDRDGYCELRWWLARPTDPGQATAVITAALDAAHAQLAAS